MSYQMNSITRSTNYKRIQKILNTLRQGIPTRRQGIPTRRQGIPTRRQGIPTRRQGIPTRRLGIPTRRDAAGWYVLPFLGEGLIGNPYGSVENIAPKRQTLPR
jgi:hypothetical protein